MSNFLEFNQISYILFLFTLKSARACLLTNSQSKARIANATSQTHARHFVYLSHLLSFVLDLVQRTRNFVKSLKNFVKMSKKENYQCDFCEKAFSNIAQLQKHVQKIRED